MSKLLKFSKSFWETAVAYGGSKPIVLRDYDILLLHKKGKTCGEIAIKYDITCMQVTRIIQKYQ